MARAERYPRLWLLLPMAVYLAFPTRGYYWDGLTFAINVEKQLPLRDLLSPSHLIYSAASLWLYQLVLGFFFKTRALFLLQHVNGFLAGVSVFFVDRALRRRGASEETAVAGALVFAFAATWWKFATDVDSYIPAIFCLLVANDLIEDQRPVWKAAIWHALAMLFHQLAILYLVVAAVRLKPARRWLGYAAISLGITAAVFVAAYRVTSGGFDPAQFPAWLTTHSPDSGFSFRPVANLGFTLRGTLRLFFGGKPGSVWMVAAVLAAIGLAAWFTRMPVSKSGETQWSKADTVWLAVYLAFLFFWMPQNTFYRLFYLAPAVLLALRKVPLRCIAVALFLWNGVFLIYPQARIDSNVPLRFALDQKPHWPEGTPIAFHQFHPDLWTISYFNPQAYWIGLPAMDAKTLDDARADAATRGESLWLEATAYDFVEADPAGRNWLAEHPVANVVRYADEKHEFRFYQLR